MITLLHVLLFLLIPVFAHAQSPFVLTWTDNSSGTGQEDRFEVERRADAGSYLILGTTGPDVATFSDSLVVSGILYTYRVRACNSTGCSGYSNEAAKMAEAGQPPAAPGAPTIAWVETLPIVALINFQPASVPLPSGYQKDDGSIYSAVQGYGWDLDLTGNTRDRNVHSDQRLDTFVYVNAGATATWNYSVPNGSYLVTLAAGDAQWAQGPHRVEVEGVVTINNVATAVNVFVTRTDVPVMVSDGSLTVTIGSPTSGNSMLNYVEIRQP